MLVDLTNVATVMQWRTPSDKEKWCARMLGGFWFYRGMTPAEAVHNARTEKVSARSSPAQPAGDEQPVPETPNADLFG